MPTIKNISCTIHTAELGQLPEYSDPGVSGSFESNQITRYITIDGAEGKHFWVRFAVIPSQESPGKEEGGYILKTKDDRLCFYPKVDGVKLYSSARCSQREPVNDFHGPKDDNGEDQLLAFSKLNIVEEEDASTVTTSSADTRMLSLGKIQVDVYRAMCYTHSRRQIKSRKYSATNESPQNLVTSEVIHHKAVKGHSASHGIKFLSGSSQPTIPANNKPTTPPEKHSKGKKSEPPVYSTSSIRLEDKTPFATFIFLYRTINTLQNMGVLPMAPEEADQYWNQSLIRQEPAEPQPAEATAAYLKREAAKDPATMERASKRIKKEERPIAQPQPRLEPEFVDLTADD